jgi:hypothetical protein
MIIRPDRARPTWRTWHAHPAGLSALAAAYLAVTAMKVDGGWKQARRIRMERRK